MDPALALGIALVAGGVACVSVFPLIVLLVGVLGMLRARGERPSRVVLVVALVSLVVGGWRASAAIARHEAARSQAWGRLPAPSRCTGLGVVVSSPVMTHGLLRWDGDLTQMTCEGRDVTLSAAHEGVRAGLYGGPDDLARGDSIELTAQLATVERFWNDATGDPRPSDARRAVLWSGSVVDLSLRNRSGSLAARIDRARAYIRGRIEATFPADARAMARALVLGESDLSDVDDADFRASGLAHLLAVSGMHLVLVVAGAIRVARTIALRVPRIAAAYDVGQWTAALAIPLVWIYAEFAGAGGSTLRAAWMMTASLLARALGRRSTAPRAFGLSLIAMAVADPLVIFDLSFLLSGGATAGLIALSRPLETRLRSLANQLPARVQPLAIRLASAVAPTLAATFPCAPILARFAPTQPLGGVIANLLAVPLGESIALPVCLLHAVAAPISPVERGAAFVATGALRLVRVIAHGFAHFRPLLVSVPAPDGWQLVLFAAAFVMLASAGMRRRLLVAVAAALALTEVGRIRAGSPRGGLRATFLDVGQGDAALVDLPDGQAILIDGGGIVGSPVDTGTRVIAPALRDRRRRELAVVILSHPHPDHFTGLVSGLEGVHVGALWDTGQGEREGVRGGYAELLTRMRARGVPVLRPDSLCGERLLGGARVEVLAPCPGPTSDRGPNDNSLVVRISLGRRSFLFVGDSERAAETDLVVLGRERLRADVLKVGHHGSRTSSTPAFLAAVAPSFAVISCGLRNRFGHPHPMTLESLRLAHASLLRTDADGAVTAWTDGERLDVHSERE